MTPEDTARIRELPTLIENESNPDKMKLLAAELGRLLSAERRERLKKGIAERPSVAPTADPSV